MQLRVVQFEQLWRRFLLRRRVLVMTTTPATTRLPMPSGVGIGWRQEIAPLLAGMPDLRWVEVVAEGVMHGMPPALRRLRDDGVTVIPHGVRLGLGDAEGLDEHRIAHFADAARITGAPLVSEHIAFVRSGGVEAGHLLPLPRTREAVDVMVANVKRVQAELDVPIALEPIAAVFTWPEDELTEAQFVTEIVERTDAMLLLDIANVYANARNHGWDALEQARAMPLERLAYMHVAGGAENEGIYHDTHAHRVEPEVLALIAELSTHTQLPAAMLERDGNYPPASELLGELDAIADAARMPRVSTQVSVGV